MASGRVELRAGCCVEGDIRALRLAVEDNAVFRGKVDLTQAVGKAPTAPTLRMPAAYFNRVLRAVRPAVVRSTARGFQVV